MACAGHGLFRRSPGHRARAGLRRGRHGTDRLAQAVRIEEPGLQFRQEGLSVYRWAITQAAELARRTCELAGIRPEDLAAFIPHEANLRILEPLADQLGIPRAITARDVIHSGNTSSASIPIALAKLVRTGKVPPDSPALLFGFGGGFSYAGQVIRTRYPGRRSHPPCRSAGPLRTPPQDSTAPGVVPDRDHLATARQTQKT
ncbi:MAG TPA: 3-oxoacyl-[acyl-carrier-protein] synthase III C-terminal domain-containing protein [Arthrobacter sp.]